MPAVVIFNLLILLSIIYFFIKWWCNLSSQVDSVIHIPSTFVTCQNNISIFYIFNMYSSTFTFACMHIPSKLQPVFWLLWRQICFWWNIWYYKEEMFCRIRWNCKWHMHTVATCTNMHKLSVRTDFCCVIQQHIRCMSAKRNAEDYTILTLLIPLTILWYTSLSTVASPPLMYSIVLATICHTFTGLLE